ncbi:hypothetical protein TNCV_4633751 [Trichonephila clavipes]|nr:hypothetical protein TNCV_4633751 [Trichonephila clavipes]
MSTILALKRHTFIYHQLWNIPPGQPVESNVHALLAACPRERHIGSQSAKKLFKTHPDEEHKPRLPDSIAQPITNMPLSRMENTTFAKPSIIDSHDMGLRTVLQSGRPKENAYDEGERILEKAWLVSPR